jgi:hypothetical protein
MDRDVENAFHAVVEAAYAMQEAGKRWGRSSKELELASKAYENCMAEYYELTGKSRTEHWDKYCNEDPSCQECKQFDL